MQCNCCRTSDIMLNTGHILHIVYVGSNCRHHIHCCIWLLFQCLTILLYALLLLIAEAVLNEKEIYNCVCRVTRVKHKSTMSRNSVNPETEASCTLCWPGQSPLPIHFTTSTIFYSIFYFSLFPFLTCFIYFLTFYPFPLRFQAGFCFLCWFCFICIFS